MAAWLFAAIERLLPRVRRAGLAATAVLLLGGAITLLTLEASTGGAGRRPTPAVLAPARRPAAQPMPPRLRPPVFGSNRRLARRVAGQFLSSYLTFAYGSASATSVKAITPVLRSEFIRDRVQVTPAEDRRHPRVASLRMLATSPGFIVATASVEDGGIAAYRLRFTLREEGGRWLVSDVREG